MILVTGVNGQLGYDVIEELKKRNIEYLAASRAEFDVTDAKKVDEFIGKVKPECVIHCAAYTAVDKAEDEKDLCYRVNADGTENIAKACSRIDAKLIYISTDYVYGGKGDKPFNVDDDINPLSVYGKSKYEGELRVMKYLKKYFIVRISWVFGKNGNNFVKTMLRLGKEKEQINVVDDQIGSPTYTKDLAPLLCDMAQTEKYGIYNATNEGFCSWAEFAKEIMNQGGLKCKVNFIPTSEYPSKAVRPLNSRMSKDKLRENGFKLLPDWKTALNDYLGEIR